jgi:carbamoyl-phosphate synthase small subunit
MITTSHSRRSARLVLEDGTVFHGLAFGACDKPFTSMGEVVFNTAMTGYQEALTDPSYAGQILAMTASMIGNYGIAEEDVESGRPQVAGFVIRELSRITSNQRSITDLSTWLAKAGVLGIEGIDTRALVRRLRSAGAMKGAISCDAAKSDSELIEMARAAPDMAGCNLAAVVSPRERSQWKENLGGWAPGTGDTRVSPVRTTRPGETPGPPESLPSARTFRVLALDCGAKRNIYRHLAERGCEVTIVPHDVSAAAVRAFKPDGLFISNGPGDPAAVQATINTLREVAGEYPTFGICLGHQLLALSLGAKTYKLKFGHRGANQPVRNLLTNQVEITSQNHGFCVEPDSLKRLECEVTHLHMNDETVAGFQHRRLPLFAVQYHPEASPGPHDSSYLFDCFLRMMSSRKPLTADEMRRSYSAAASV